MVRKVKKNLEIAGRIHLTIDEKPDTLEIHNNEPSTRGES